MFWHRFVDDTFVIHKEVNKQGFLQNINSNDPAIKFTVEDNKEDGPIPFLDTTVKPEADGTLSITVYKKPTHSDQYLQWDSHHHLSAKFSVIHTLSHRVKMVCSKLSYSNRKRTTSGRLSPNANIQNELWTRWRKDSTGLPVRLLMGLTTKALQLSRLPLMELKLRVTLSYPTQKVFVKASKRFVVDMAFKPPSKVAGPSRTSWSPQGQRPHGQPKWCHILVPIWCPRLWWIHRGSLQDLWWKIQGTPEGPLSYSSPQQPNRPLH